MDKIDRDGGNKTQRLSIAVPIMPCQSLFLTMV